MKAHFFAFAIAVSLSGAPRFLCAEHAPQGAGAASTAGGGAETQYQLARKYLRGEGVPRNPAKACELMQRSAALDHPEALGGVGYFHATGLVVPRDEAEAVRWYRRGAEKGGARAQLNLGLALVAGRGVSKDEAGGLQWIDRAAAQGLAEALHMQGEILYHGKHGRAQDHHAAFAAHLRAAEAGHSDSQNTVAVMLRDGLGVASDMSKAEQWFRAAAEHRHSRAQSGLGHLLGPDGTDASRRVEAVKWLILASDQNEATAIKTLEEITPGLPLADLAEAHLQAAAFRNPKHTPPNK